MKKIITLLVSIILILTSTSVFALSDMVTISIVDNEGVAVSNATVVVSSDNGKWITQATKTDRFGTIRLYDNSSKMKNIGKNIKYVVDIMQQNVNNKVQLERFDCYFDKLKNGDNYTIKLKNASTKDDVYNAENRADFYVTNSKGGVVRNLKVNLTMQTPQIPQTNGTETEKSYAVYSGYTDVDGRLTLLDMPADTYTVKFFWRGGSCDAGEIIIKESKGITAIKLSFNEKLLQ
ncbi:MAG: hypothetical protein RSE93_01920 [Oscillospiraceae bacterium]